MTKELTVLASFHEWKISFESPATVELSLCFLLLILSLRPSLHYVGIESVLNVVGLACR